MPNIEKSLLGIKISSRYSYTMKAHMKKSNVRYPIVIIDVYAVKRLGSVKHFPPSNIVSLGFSLHSFILYYLTT
jgi:hypothetical protein